MVLHITYDTTCDLSFNYTSLTLVHVGNSNSQEWLSNSGRLVCGREGWEPTVLNLD